MTGFCFRFDARTALSFSLPLPTGLLLLKTSPHN